MSDPFVDHSSTASIEQGSLVGQRLLMLMVAGSPFDCFEAENPLDTDSSEAAFVESSLPVAGPVTKLQLEENSLWSHLSWNFGFWVVEIVDLDPLL
jgi:hypothetical protein